MIAALTKLAIGAGVAQRWARAAAWLAIVVAIAAVAGGAYWWIYGRGATAGAAKVTAAIQIQDADRREEVRVDERAAQETATTVGVDVGRQTRAADVAQQTTIKDLRHVIDSIPSAQPGAVPSAAPVDELRATLNRATERANRAAEAAEARR